MQLMKVDPRALKDNPDNTRQSKSTPQADALLLATIKAVGVIQPPVIFAEAGGNGYTIEAGHRRTRMAIAAGIEEIDVLVVEPANDNGAMRSMIENIAREPLNPVDQWRGIERLVALGWTEEAVAVALALPVRQIRKLRLLANVLPAMLDQMARGDMPNEQQLRAIAAAALDEQKEVWKAHKPKKGDTAQWWSVANALNKKRMYAKDASFGADLSAAYGIEWAEDLFGPADQDNRYTTDVEAYLGAQQEWMTSNLTKKGAIVEVNSWGQPELPKKASQVYGKPGKNDQTGMYLDREGKVQIVHYRLPETNQAKGHSNAAADGSQTDMTIVSNARPDVTQKGLEMIGDFRTDALHEALARAPIEDDMLIALLVLSLAGPNVRIDSGANDHVFGRGRFERHAARLLTVDGRLSFDMDTVRAAARSALIDVLSCRRGMSNSGVAALVAGETVGADAFLPNMGTEDFLSCLSRQSLEATAKEANVQPRPRVRETRAALVEHFGKGHLVHSAALFAPDAGEVANLLKASEHGNGVEEEVTNSLNDAVEDDAFGNGDGELAPAVSDQAEDGADEPGGAHVSEEDDAACGIAAE